MMVVSPITCNGQIQSYNRERIVFNMLTLRMYFFSVPLMLWLPDKSLVKLPGISPNSISERQYWERQYGGKPILTGRNAGPVAMGVWYKNGYSYLVRRHGRKQSIVIENGNLLFTKAQMQDEGVYACANGRGLTKVYWIRIAGKDT